MKCDFWYAYAMNLLCFSFFLRIWISMFAFYFILFYLSLFKDQKLVGPYMAIGQGTVLGPILQAKSYYCF